ncbi:MAG: NADH-quinone oxidoreductase subunit K [Clostridia bacterium]|nr:NADH-quinone oxidoreductase subunit K [Clostridia bacterium]
MSLSNYEELAAIALFGIGLTLLILDRNLIKKIIGFSMSDAGIYLYLAARGYVEGRRPPIVENGVTDAAAYINPIPTGLVLTGIVVSVASSAVFLALAVRLYERYRTLNLDEITDRVRKEEE